MKKFLVVLLSLGLILAFSMTASAADVKFSGSYYLSGVYWNNPTAADDNTAYSRAFFYQRFRLQPVFQIAEGLTFTTRIDALEKQWGNTTWKGGYSDEPLSRKVTPQGGGEPTRGIQENVEWERAYVTFKTAIGLFQVGYQDADEWGTAFGDNGTTRPRILYALPIGPVTLTAIYEKFYETDTATGVNVRREDSDYDTYAFAGIGKFKGGEAGLLLKYYLDHSKSVAALGGYKQDIYLIGPYAKATFGPVYVEGEFNYFGGKYKEFTAPGHNDVDLSGWNAYAMAKVKLGPVNVGGLAGYSTGDDGTDTSKFKTYPGGSGTSWNPALLLMNDDLNTWSGGTGTTTNPAGITSKKFNMLLLQAFADFTVIPKLNLGASVTWAKVNEKLTAVDDKLGTEFDVTATYKIYDNLSYMVGAGYLLTGDYFKGANANKEVGNDYLLLNKLTLNF